jgi:hypothetical protein
MKTEVVVSTAIARLLATIGRKGEELTEHLIGVEFCEERRKVLRLLMNNK